MASAHFLARFENRISKLQRDGTPAPITNSNKTHQPHHHHHHHHASTRNPTPQPHNHNHIPPPLQQEVQAFAHLDQDDDDHLLHPALASVVNPRSLRRDRSDASLFSQASSAPPRQLPSDLLDLLDSEPPADDALSPLRERQPSASPTRSPVKPPSPSRAAAEPALPSKRVPSKPTALELQKLASQESVRFGLDCDHRPKRQQPAEMPADSPPRYAHHADGAPRMDAGGAQWMDPDGLPPPPPPPQQQQQQQRRTPYRSSLRPQGASLQPAVSQQQFQQQQQQQQPQQALYPQLQPAVSQQQLQQQQQPQQALYPHPHHMRQMEAEQEQMEMQKQQQMMLMQQQLQMQQHWQAQWQAQMQQQYWLQQQAQLMGAGAPYGDENHHHHAPPVAAQPILRSNSIGQGSSVDEAVPDEGVPRVRSARCGRRAASSQPARREPQQPPRAASSASAYSNLPSSSQASSRVAHGRRKTPMYDEATLKTPPMTAENVPRREFRSRLNGEYKKYSGKVSSEYFVLGRMKPNLDTDELLQKRANKEKVKTFSKNLTALNREIIARMPQAAPSASAPPSKFQRAKSYGSSVPRPRPSNSAAGSRNAESIAEELDELQLLEIEHEDRRQQAAKIRRELGL